MIKFSFLRRSILLFIIWLSFSPQLCWGDQACDVSVALHPPQHDTLKISDKWMGWDKAEHIGVSAFFSGVFYSIFRDFYNNNRESSLYFSATLTFSLGLGKEFYDKRTPQKKFSYKDLVADILGIGLGLWIATR
jgi:putative lipoprotein